MNQTAPASSRSAVILREVTRHGTFWPVVALVLLVLACGVRSPGFLDVTVQDGHLFGQIIDLLRNSATPLLLALGMCLVIATGGSTSRSARSWPSPSPSR